MLANLWDVTDRDIDKLSSGVFSRWGLCNSQLISHGGSDDAAEPEQAMGSGVNFFTGPSVGERKRQLHANMKGKKCIATNKRGISLTYALARARDDCTLKYLNGAAPVIYGVPVCLGEK